MEAELSKGSKELASVKRENEELKRRVGELDGKVNEIKGIPPRSHPEPASIQIHSTPSVMKGYALDEIKVSDPPGEMKKGVLKSRDKETSSRLSQRTVHFVELPGQPPQTDHPPTEGKTIVAPMQHMTRGHFLSQGHDGCSTAGTTVDVRFGDVDRSSSSQRGKGGKFGPKLSDRPLSFWFYPQEVFSAFSLPSPSGKRKYLSDLKRCNEEKLNEVVGIMEGFARFITRNETATFNMMICTSTRLSWDEGMLQNSYKLPTDWWTECLVLAIQRVIAFREGSPESSKEYGRRSKKNAKTFDRIIYLINLVLEVCRCRASIEGGYYRTEWI